jgi:hypothetical protein
MLGFYDNFPVNIHRKEKFTTKHSSRALQQKLVQVFREINSKTFSFDEIVQSTLPESIIIFEMGLAEGNSFNYIDRKETKKVSSALRKDALRTIDLFCAIRYYKKTAEKKTPLRFDYYMIRMAFNGNTVEIQVFHERGPRYLSPEDVISFLVKETNKTSERKTLLAPEFY